MEHTEGISPRKNKEIGPGNKTGLANGFDSFQKSNPDRLIDQAFGNFKRNGRSHRRLLAAGRPITRFLDGVVGMLAGEGAMRLQTLGPRLVSTKDDMVTAVGMNTGLAKCQNKQPEDKSPRGCQVWHC